MRWHRCELISTDGTERDQLGNPISKEKTVKSTWGRFTPWDDTDLHLDGRTVTRQDRKLAVRMPLAHFPDCQKVKVQGVCYSIDRVTDMGRFTLLYICNTQEDNYGGRTCGTE